MTRRHSRWSFSPRQKGEGSAPLRARTAACLSLLVSLVAGCASSDSEQAETKDTLKLAVLDCGNVTVNDLSLLTPGANEGKKKKLTSTCFAVLHPEGTLLWNTGLSDQLGPEPITVFDGGFDLSVTHPLLPQLAELGLRPEDIDYLALSHFHDDHTGNVNAFSSATLLIQEPEYEAIYGKEPELYGFDPRSYADVDKEKARVLDGQHDVFGDGRVIIVPAPGHSPGHQVLLIDLEETGPILLSGDLYHFTKAREDRTVPAFNADPDASRASMERIESLIDERGATLWIQHDFEQMSELRRAPKVYE